MRVSSASHNKMSNHFLKFSLGIKYHAICMTQLKIWVWLKHKNHRITCTYILIGIYVLSYTLK